MTIGSPRDLLRPRPSAIRRPSPAQQHPETLERRLLLATHTWTGAASGLWSDAANWTGGSPAGDAQAILSFPASATNRTTNNDLTGLSVSSLDFAGGDYVLGGNAVTLAQGPLGAPRVHMDAASKGNTISLALGRADAGLGVTFDVAGGSTLTVSGVISGGSVASTIAKDGEGKLVLTASNTFADGVVISLGTVNVRDSLALGTSPAGEPNVTTISGGTLESQGSLFLRERLTQGSGGGTLRNVTGNTTWAGDVSLAFTDLNVVVDQGSVTVTGKVADDATGPAVGLVKSGGGKFILAAANTYRGATTVNGGTLAIKDPSALGTSEGGTVLHADTVLELQGTLTTAAEPLTMDGGVLGVRSGNSTWTGPVTIAGTRPSFAALGGALTVGGVIGGLSDLSIDAAAPGKIILTQANTFTGATRVNGVLNVRNASALGAAGGAGVFVEEGGALELELQGTNTINESVSLIGTGVNGTGALRNVSGANDWAGSVPLVANVRPAIGVSGGQLTISGVIQEAPTDFLGGFSKVGAGPLRLTAENRYQGRTDVLGGSLFVDGLQNNDSFHASSSLSAGARLGGTGVAGGFFINGVVNPGGEGSAVGRLNVQEGSFGIGGVFEIDINGPSAGTGYDQVTTGRLDLRNGQLKVNLNFTPLTVMSFTILEKNGTAILPSGNTFARLQEGETITTTRGKLRITYKGGDGDDVVLTTIPNTRPDLGLPQSAFVTTASRFPDRTVTAEADEGGVVTVTGTISDPDPGDRFFLDVDWGDGSKVQKFKFPPGSDGQQISLTHRYLDDDPTGTADDAYTIHLSWRDRVGQGNSATLSTVVRNRGPEVSPVAAATLKKNGTLSQAIAFTDPGKDSWTAVVDFGDDSEPLTIDLRNKTKLKLKHLFAQSRTYTVTVTITDDDGGIGTTSFDVTR